MKKITGIEYLKECITDTRNPLLYKEAQKKDFEIMDEFSKWITDNEWNKNYTNDLWFHSKKIYEHFKFSDVYQIFLKSREA
jgi:hypothetical protein